jgi:uncharacterized membrane protein HdeD (DUF308 family)
MIAGDVKAAYNRSKWGIALRGLFGIIIGLVILTRPIASVAAVALVVALWAMVEGIIAIMHAFELRATVSHWWLVLLTGVVSALFGVAALYYYPALSLSFVVLWVAWWLLTAGAIAVAVATQERRAGVSWGWTMAFGVLTIAAGILAIVYPGVTLAWLLSLLAAFGIIGGVMRLMIAFRLQSFERDVKHAVGSPARS